MCSHYQAVTSRDRYFKQFGVYPPAHPYVEDVWPGYSGAIIRRPREADAGDEAVPALESVSAAFGMVPHWVKDEKQAKQSMARCFNSRSETAATLPSFRDAWRYGRRCIIPADAIFEPDWRTGKHIPTRISLANGEPMGLAGLWSWWKNPATGEDVVSFAMLTVNADDHDFMRNYHRPGDEKRMVVVLNPDAFDAWLDAPTDRAGEFMRRCPAEALVAQPMPR
jgi:putative SOS response-associated peptidase YedK